MKTLFILIGTAACLWLFSPGTGRKDIPGNILPGKMDSINFKTQVQPILQTNCSPCHFPGGKLYEKLPFDKAETILNHQPGILKRIKKEEDIKLIKHFAAQHKVVALK